MEFLGNQSAQPRTMKCQILAQEALPIALIETLDDNKKKQSATQPQPARRRDQGGGLELDGDR